MIKNTTSNKIMNREEFKLWIKSTEEFKRDEEMKIYSDIVYGDTLTVLIQRKNFLVKLKNELIDLFNRVNEKYKFKTEEELEFNGSDDEEITSIKNVLGEVDSLMKWCQYERIRLSDFFELLENKEVIFCNNENKKNILNVEEMYLKHLEKYGLSQWIYLYIKT